MRRSSAGGTRPPTGPRPARRCGTPRRSSRPRRRPRHPPAAPRPGRRGAARRSGRGRSRRANPCPSGRERPAHPRLPRSRSENRPALDLAVQDRVPPLAYQSADVQPSGRKSTRQVITRPSGRSRLRIGSRSAATVRQKAAPPRGLPCDRRAGYHAAPIPSATERRRRASAAPPGTGPRRRRPRPGDRGGAASGARLLDLPLRRSHVQRARQGGLPRAGPAARARLGALRQGRG